MALLSRAALEGVKASLASSRVDNVLLEYELAVEKLQIDPTYLIPVWCGTDEPPILGLSEPDEQMVRHPARLFPHTSGGLHGAQKRVLHKGVVVAHERVPSIRRDLVEPMRNGERERNARIGHVCISPPGTSSPPSRDQARMPPERLQASS